MPGGQKNRVLFVAGASGATGKVLVPLARERGFRVVPHYRPSTAGKLGTHLPEGAVVCDLHNTSAVVDAMRGCTTIISLIGTMRSRFRAGDTYQTSDIDTAQQLADAANQAGNIDHFILLSSVGADWNFGSYLKAKAEAENRVKNSGLPYTIFRPSALSGGERKVPSAVGAVTRFLELHQFVPITLEQLSLAILKCASERAPLGKALEGEPLWALVPKEEKKEP